MVRRLVISILLWLTVASAMSACGAGFGGSHPSNGGDELPGVAPAPGIAGAPDVPRGYPKLPGLWETGDRGQARRVSASEIAVAGSAFFEEFGENNRVEQLDLVIVPGGDDPLAYAVYAAPGLINDRPTRISLDIQPATIVPGGSDELPLKYYLAMANYSSGVWDTYGPFERDKQTGDIPSVEEVLNSQAYNPRYVNAACAMYFAILCLPDQEFVSAENPQGLTGATVKVATVETLAVSPSLDPAYRLTRPIFTQFSAATGQSLGGGAKGGSALDPSQYVELTWSHYFDPIALDLNAFQYQITRTDPGKAEITLGTVSPTPICNFVDDNSRSGLGVPDLIPGEKYRYRLWGISPANGYSGKSDQLVVVPLLPPSNVSASDGLTDDRIRISWDKPAGATQYLIERFESAMDPPAWVPIIEVGDVDYWDDQGLGDYADHLYRVTARRHRLWDGLITDSPPSNAATGRVNHAPVACFTTIPDPPEGEPPLHVAFDANCSTDADGHQLFYAWDFNEDGDFGDDTQVLASYDFDTAGSYDVWLKVTDEKGGEDLISMEVRVGAPPVACFEVDKSYGPAPLSVAFDGSCSHDTDPSDIIQSWAWDFGDPHNPGGAGGVTTNHNYTVGGLYTPSLTVVDDEFLDDDVTGEITILVNTKPVACFDSDVDEGAPPLTVNFDASCSVDPDDAASDSLDIVEYTWDFGDGSAPATRAIPTVSHTYLTSGTYTVTLTVEDDEGVYEDSTDALSMQITVNNPPTADLVATPNTGNQPLEVTLDASGSSDIEDGTNLQYSFFTGKLGAQWTPYSTVSTYGPVTYTSPGVKTARVRVKDSNGKVSPEDTATITVTNTPPVADLTATPDSGAPPLEVTFDASGSSDPDGSVANYEWDFDDDGTYSEAGAESDAQGQSIPAPYTYGAAGTYTATVRVTDNNSDPDTASVVINVSDPRTEWWMYGKDPRHQRRSNFTGPATNAGKWTFTTGGVVYSSPAVSSSGVIYFGSADNKLYAVNPDGSQRWAFTTGGDVDSSPAIAGDGTVYVGSNDGMLYAVNSDGSQKWAFVTGGAVNASPAVGPGGTIYVGSEDNNLYAVNPDGTQKWAYAAGGIIQKCSPAIAGDGTVYIGSWDDKLHAVNSNGTVKWTYPIGGDIVSSPAIASDGTVYVGDSLKKLWAINPDGSFKWSQTFGHNYVYCSPAIAADGTVYVGNYDNNLYALDPADGSVDWSFPAGNFVHSSPAIDAAGTIYFGSHDGKLYAANPGDGSQKWSYSAGAVVVSSPAIGPDGTIYVGCNDGKLHAIGPPNWAVHTVDAGFNGNGGDDQPLLTMAVVSGKPAIAYMEDGSGIYYARATTSTPSATGDWVSHLVITDGGSNMNIHSGPRLLEIGGKPAFCYYAGAALRFAISNVASPSSASDWTEYKIDGGSGGNPDFSGVMSSFAVVNGLPAIACTGNMVSDSNSRIRYARATTAVPTSATDWVVTWATSSTGSEEHQPCGLVDLAGKPAIAWYKKDTKDLYFAAATSATPGSAADWPAHAVETTGPIGRQLQIRVIAGKPAIAYADWTDGTGNTVHLRYARATITVPASGSDWVINDVGSDIMGDYAIGFSSLGGLPCLSYLNRTGGVYQMKYALATSGSPSGPADWVPEVVEDSNQTGLHSSLQVLSGNPIIAYYNNSAGALMFAWGNN